MSYRRTLVIFLIFAILGAFFYFYEVKGATSRNQEKEKLLASFKPEDISSVSVIRPNESIVVEKKNDKWSIIQPIHAPAEQDKVESLVKAVTALKYERDLGQQPDLAAFKLADPEMTIEIAGAREGRERILIGSLTPDGKNFYVKREGGGEIYTALASAREQFDQNLFQLRDKKVVDFPRDEVSALTISRGGQSLKMEKKGDDWSMTEPAAHDADADEISDLLDSIHYARVKKFVEENASNLEPYGLKQAQARVQMQVGANLYSLVFGKEAEGELVYAAVGDVNRVVELDKSIRDKITADPANWRDKRLAKIDSSEIVKLDVENNGTRVLLEKEKENPEEWMMLEPQRTPADNNRVDSILRTLSRAKATGFVEDKKLKEARGLLKNPQLRFRLWKKEQEQPLEVSFARRGETPQWLALTRAGEVATVGEEQVKELMVGPDELTDKSVARFEAPSVEKIELVKKDKTYSLKRKDTDWKIPRGLEIQAYEVDQFLWNLRELKYTGKSAANGNKKLGSPVLTVRLWEAEKKEAKEIVFAQNPSGADSSYLVSVGGELMEVDGAAISEFMKKLK